MHTLASILLLVFSVQNSLAHGDSNGNGFKFVGDNHWADQHRELCDRKTTKPYPEHDLSCYTYHINLERVNVELLSREPILLVYRNFANKNEIGGFLEDVSVKQLELQKVVVLEEENQVATSRRANGTWLEHVETPGVEKVFRKAQRLIPHVNFNSGEQWQVLSYHPGGHYAPHYDYLEYENEKQWDWWMNNMGNRFATFLLVLKTADNGGGTVFPMIDKTVQPNPGDVIFWTNMSPSGEISSQSLHGACPIYEGQKIAATIWLRQRGQEVLSKSFKDMFHVNYFISPQTGPNSYLNKDFLL